MRDQQVIEITAPGGPETLNVARRPIPTPGHGEILLRIEAAGVNRPDLLQRSGHYAPPPGASDLPGLEAAGEVVAVGEGVDPAIVGSKRTALCAGGGYAQYVTVPESHALTWPEGFSAIEAAALPETFFTVYGNMVLRGALKAGETVLIHGGASGIGTTAIQMAKGLGAGKVIVTVGTSDKAAACLALGADHAFIYKDKAWEEEVRKATDKKGADVIIDMVAGPYVSRNQACLAADGRLVIIAVQGGVDARFNAAIAMVKRQTITGSTLRPQSIEAKAEIARGLAERVWPLLNDGSITPQIQNVYALEDATAAHAELEAGNHVGKIMLEVSHP